jgi:nickel/cobalt transporter (NicO) family protein
VALRVRIHLLLALLLVAAVACLDPPAAKAHDIPNERIDRSIQVTLSPGSIAIDYEVSLSELTLTQDLRKLIGSLPGADRQQWLDRYGQVTGPLNAKGLLVAAAGEPVTLLMRSFDVVVEDHPRYTFHMSAVIPAGGRLRVRDVNYVSSEGTSRLAIRGLAGVVVTGDSLPGIVGQIEIRPTWMLSDEEERRTKQVQVDYRAPDQTGAGSVSLEELAGGDLHLSRPVAQQPSPANVLSLFDSRRLSALLDEKSTPSWLLLVVIAVSLGAAHAVQPGHGKTLVTAVALGPDIRFYQPALLGLTATLAHMGSVLLIALVLWFSGATRVAGVHEALTKVAGFAIGAVGLWRLGRQLGGYPEHDDPSSPFVPRRCVSAPSRESAPSSINNRGLIALGLSGGAVPCWDAVSLLLLAAALGKLAAGVTMVLAFSAGMAIVLVVVGLLAWKLKATALGSESRSRWRKPLAVASSGILAAIGFYLFFQ